MKRRIYEFGDYRAKEEHCSFFVIDRHTEPLTESPHPPLNEKGGIRTTDRKIMYHMVQRSFQRQRRIFTDKELYEVGWGAGSSEGLTDEDLDRNVQPAISRLRKIFKDVLPNKPYCIGVTVLDVTPADEPVIQIQQIVIGCVTTALTVVLYDTPTRALCQMLNLSVTFDTRNAEPPLPAPAFYGMVLGIFQGIIGALSYSVPISLVLFGLWFAVFRFDPWRTKLSVLKTAAGAVVAGTLGGFFISIAALFAQHIKTLQAARWVPAETQNRWAAFSVVKIGYAMPWFGFWVGLSATLTLVWILRRKSWFNLLSNHPKITDLEIAAKVYWAIFKLGMGWSVLFVAPTLILSSFVFYFGLFQRPLELVNFPFSRVLGESLIISMGGMSLVVGFLVALFSLSKGVDIVGEQKCSLVDPRLVD